MEEKNIKARGLKLFTEILRVIFRKKSPKMDVDFGPKFLGFFVPLLLTND